MIRRRRAQTQVPQTQSRGGLPPGSVQVPATGQREALRAALRAEQNSAEQAQQAARRLSLPRRAWPSGSSPTWWVVHPNHGHLRRQRGRGCGAVSNDSAGRPGTYRRPGWTRTRAAAARCKSLHHSTRAAATLAVLVVDLTPFWLECLGSFAKAQNRSVGAPSHV